MNIAFFGSSLVSAYWNGAATYYRGIIRALQAQGHRVTFYEPDAYDRQKNRDIADPPWAEVVVYEATKDEACRMLDRAKTADVIVKASGVGVFDELLEAGILQARRADGLAIFWDVDAPATLERLHENPQDAFIPLIPRYDLVLTYGGGAPVVADYLNQGAKQCVPIYNALDPETHHPVEFDPDYASDLSFLGNRLPDREARVDEFFLKAAHACPRHRFLFGGNGWGDKPLPPNVDYVGHVGTTRHNVWNCSAKAVLNINRAGMARYGYSPATRVFEATGAGACLVTDYWVGIPEFFEPEKEILVAHDGDEVARLVDELTPKRAKEIGQAALKRALAEHTYEQRVRQLIEVLEGASARV